MKTISSVLALLATVAVLGAAGPRASASVMDYHAFAQSHGDTLVQYDFDGLTDAQRREDKKGSNDLIQKIATMYGVGGFDTSSQAVSGGFFTTNPLNLPQTVSFEAIVAPTATSGNGYMVASYDGTNQRRGYFALGTDSKLVAAAGTSWLNRSGYVDPYVVGDWYYLAATMSYAPGTPGQTTINTYVANLSENQTSLTHYGSMTNVVVNGDFHTGLAYGIGLVNANGTPSEPLSSIIDEVTFYSGLKDQAFFQANLDRIFHVPEPSSALLLLAGIGILGVIVRRRRFHPGLAQAVRSDG